MKDGQKIIFYGKGDQESNLEPGNIIIVIDVTDHQTFTRKGTNLFITLEISLTEALCGFTKLITTLDKRTLVANTLVGSFFFCIMNKIINFAVKKFFFTCLSKYDCAN